RLGPAPSRHRHRPPQRRRGAGSPPATRAKLRPESGYSCSMRKWHGHAAAPQSCSMPGAISMPGTMGRLTIVVPVLNEAAIIVAALRALAPLRARGAEIIVADGYSRDGTARLAEPFADRIITVRRGRGAAMNAGAALGTGDALLFLHADTALPDGTDRLIDEALAHRAWGRFDLRIAGSHPLLTVIARMINWR